MSDLRCDEFVELVTMYLEGTLSAEDRRRVEDHLPNCEGCARYLDQIRQSIGTLGALPAEALPESARAALLAAFRQEGPRS